jgi:hypothetical protein
MRRWAHLVSSFLVEGPIARTVLEELWDLTMVEEASAEVVR